MLQEENIKKEQEFDLKRIEEICSSTWEPLYRFIYFRVQNREEAEDITQETYVRALLHIQRSGAKIDKFTSFLKTVSLNILRDKWRNFKRHGAMIDFDALNSGEAAVEDDIEERMQRSAVENALNKLGEEQRRVIELRIIKGYSTAETAKIMSKKEGTIRVLQHRALQALAEILKKDA